MISNGIIKHALITRILTDTTNGMPYMICSQKGVKQNVIASSTKITLNSQVPNNDTSLSFIFFVRFNMNKIKPIEATRQSPIITPFCKDVNV